MIIYYISNVAIASLFMIGCNGQNLDKIPDSQNSNKIVIIFKSMPDYPTEIKIGTKLTVENGDPIISYYDNYIKSDFTPKKLTSDTLIIAPKCNNIMLTHSFNTISSKEYLIKKGDTVIFKYHNGIPMASLKNEKSNNIGFAYEDLIRKRINKVNGFTPYEIYKNPFFSNDLIDPDMVINFMHKIKAESYIKAKASFKMEKQFLDSLKAENKISSPAYNFYSGRAKYLTKCLDLEQKLHSPMLKIESFEPPDPSCTYSYYFNYLQTYFFVEFERKAKVIHQSNGQITDYRNVYDSVARQKIFPAQLKNMLLYKYFILISENFSKVDFQKYLEKIKMQITDPTLLAEINTRFITSSYAENENQQLNFLDKNQQIFNLKDVIAKNKNKILYIDFWASWCLPCRAAMPSSRNLRNQYEDKNIVFIYLSLDKDFLKWKKAAIEEKLDNFENSYIVLNPDENSFLKSINLSSIPRYLLYDKKGQLNNQNAPNPNKEKELSEMFDILLNKN